MLWRLVWLGANFIVFLNKPFSSVQFRAIHDQPHHKITLNPPKRDRKRCSTMTKLTARPVSCRGVLGRISNLSAGGRNYYLVLYYVTCIIYIQIIYLR